MHQVSVLMGSKSDYPVMSEALRTLKKFGVKYDVRVISAHRTPERLVKYLKDTESEVIIAGAGGAAHLAGAVAAHTTRPVIGVPISNSMHGFDALLSTVQMPPGLPVATVGVDRASNAAILALQMLAIGNSDLQKALKSHREEMVTNVLKQDEEINSLAAAGHFGIQ